MTKILINSRWVYGKTLFYPKNFITELKTLTGKDVLDENKVQALVNLGIDVAITQVELSSLTEDLFCQIREWIRIHCGSSVNEISKEFNISKKEASRAINRIAKESMQKKYA